MSLSRRNQRHSRPLGRQLRLFHNSPNGRAGERPNTKRIITRNSFEVFEDQMDSLRDRSYQEKRAGKIGSMSAMVREAIDAYLKKNS